MIRPRKFWIMMAVIYGVIWGSLLGLVFHSLLIGTIFFVVGFLHLIMVGGMCIVSSESTKIFKEFEND